MTIRAVAYPRVGLIGNPSDGYFGRTISFAFANFQAEVILEKASGVELVPGHGDVCRAPTLDSLVGEIRAVGYSGGLPLLKATLKRFREHCAGAGQPLHERGFRLRYGSDIPRRVGLAGSSAIVTACLRALMQFYGVTIAKPAQANLALAVEKEELGISAGLQDRVAQVYQGLVYMDFDRGLMESRGYGRYEALDPARLPPLYVAYRTELAEGSEVTHNNLRFRYERGDPDVLDAIEFWKSLAAEMRERLRDGNRARIAELINANFDRRAAVCSISPGNLRMVRAARSVGASAKFCGSGGAIVGTFEDDAMFDRLTGVLQPLGVAVFRPTLAPAAG
jgi:glucuronokinase